MSAEVVLVISPSTLVVIGRPDPLRSRGSMTKGQTKLLPIRGYRGGRGSASSRCAPAIFAVPTPVSVSRNRGLVRSSSAAALSARLQAPRCGSAADGASAGGLPRALVFRRPREGLLGLCTRSFLKVPRTTSAGKPDANFLLEIKHGLNDAQQKFHAEWRGEGTIRPPINGKAQGLVRPGLL